MKNVSISGYVCTTKDDRRVRRWMAIVLLILFIGVTAVLIWQAALDGHPMFYWFVLGWMSLCVVIMIEGYRNCYVDDIAFAIELGVVSNTYPNRCVSLDLPHIRYVSILTCHMSKKAPRPEISFYLLSSNPIVDAYIEYDGLKWIRGLQEHDIVIIPQNVETDAWVTSMLKIENVPIYPKQYDRERGMG